MVVLVNRLQLTLILFMLFLGYLSNPAILKRLVCELKIIADYQLPAREGLKILKRDLRNGCQRTAQAVVTKEIIGIGNYGF